MQKAAAGARKYGIPPCNKAGTSNLGVWCTEAEQKCTASRGVIQIVVLLLVSCFWVKRCKNRTDLLPGCSNP
eukprot:1063246-Rhodomonas_salina.1